MLSKKTITYIVGGITGALFVGLTTMCIVLVATTDKEFLKDKVLAQVNNVVYDESTSTVKWDPVENANSYTLSINNEEVVVNDTFYKFLPTAKTTVYAVKANDTNSVYETGEWSRPYRFTFMDESSSYARLNQFASTLNYEDYNFEHLLTIVNNTKTYHEAIFTSLVNKDDIKYIYTIGLGYYETIEDFADLTRPSISDYTQAQTKEIYEYDAFKAVFDSNSRDDLGEEVNALISDFYSITPLIQINYTEDGKIYNRNILKAKKGQTVKYLSASYRYKPLGNIDGLESAFETLNNSETRQLTYSNITNVGQEEFSFYASFDTYWN